MNGRPAALLVMAALLTAGRAQAAYYGWTLSASQSDPLVNTIPATGTSTTVFLWYYYSGEQGGMSAAEFALAASGPTVLAVTAVNGFLNAGSLDCLLLATDCPSGYVVAATITLIADFGVVCFSSCAMDSLQLVVDCHSPVPHAWPFDWIGLGVGREPCVSTPLPVAGLSWGRLKDLYR